MSAATAHRLNVTNQSVVNLKFGDANVRAPVWILPGQADDCVTVHLGYGRTTIGHVGEGTGFNAYPLRAGDVWFASGLSVEASGDSYPLSTTQTHHSMEGRDLLRETTLPDFEQNPQFAQSEHDGELPSLYPGFAYKDHAWGMSIDLNACVGCNACIIACQAENNIPVVGKEQVAAGREMHWIRVDSYFDDLEDPALMQQPVTCMQCENAPCEPVCPVGATVHSSEGLNQMVYNRCVGTRYCSNNCPYKVRRFNFLDYTDPDLRILNNPDVTVRARGVMEKCTYCIQRINRVRIAAEEAGRPDPGR